METILRWLAGLLAGILERYASPDLQAKLDAYNAKVATAEAREKEALELERQSEAAYQESAQRRAQWDAALAQSLRNENDSQQRLRASQDRVKAIENEAAKAKEVIDRQSDADSVRADV